MLGVSDGGEVSIIVSSISPMPRTNTLYLNTEKGPFKDPAVRAAAREAIGTVPLLLGAQNMHWAEAGAFTGEISPAMLEEFGIDLSRRPGADSFAALDEV